MSSYQLSEVTGSCNYQCQGAFMVVKKEMKQKRKRKKDENIIRLLENKKKIEEPKMLAHELIYFRIECNFTMSFFLQLFCYHNDTS